MENVFALLLLLSLILLVLGFFSPSTSLFWYKKERTRKKSSLIYGIAIIAFAVLTGAVSDKKGSKSTQSNASSSSENTQENKEAELTQAQKDSIAKSALESEIEERQKQTVSAGDLTQAYVDNEVRADENYKDKKFYVEGTVADIKKGVLDEIYVTLKSGEMFREVQCYFDDKATASQLEKGMRVTFYGTCNGLMMNVLMKNCKLVDNLQTLKKQLKK